MFPLQSYVEYLVPKWWYNWELGIRVLLKEVGHWGHSFERFTGP